MHRVLKYVEAKCCTVFAWEGWESNTLVIDHKCTVPACLCLNSIVHFPFYNLSILMGFMFQTLSALWLYMCWWTGCPWLSFDIMTTICDVTVSTSSDCSNKNDDQFLKDRLNYFKGGFTCRLICSYCTCPTNFCLVPL